MPVTSLVQACSHTPSLCNLYFFCCLRNLVMSFLLGSLFLCLWDPRFLGPQGAHSSLSSLYQTLKCMGKAQCPEVLVRMHICAHQWTNLQLVHCSLNSDRLSADNRGRTPDRKGFIFSFCKISLHCCFSVSKSCLRPHGLQHTRLPYPSLFLEFAQTHVH